MTLAEAVEQPLLFAEMVASLPDDSATARAELGDDVVAWGIEGQLLAMACEILDRNNRQLVALFADQKKDPKVRRFLKSKPLRIPRPGVDVGSDYWHKRKGTTLGELMGMMGGKTEV